MLFIRLLSLCLTFYFLTPQAIQARTSHYLIRDYFDGNRWHLGPFHFIIEKKIIQSIKGPFIQKDLDIIRSNLILEKAIVYDHQELDLIPGLIDSHTHLSFEDKSLDSSHDSGIKQMFRNNKKSLALAHKRLDQAIRRGFLTIRDLGGNPEVIKKINHMITQSPNEYPALYFIRSAFSAEIGQCPKGVNCKKSFIKLPQPLKEIRKQFAKESRNIHHKIFFDNDPYSGVLKKEHVINILKSAKDKRLSMAIHTIKQKDFTWMIPYFYPELSLEHLTGFQLPKNPLLREKILNSSVKLVPTLYSKIYTQLLIKKNLDPLHWQWSRKKQIEKINSLKKLSPLFCFGSDFYYPTFSPLRDPFFYAIEILRDLSQETFLSPTEVLSMATGGCNALFPKTTSGLISVGAQASFNLVAGDLKRDLKYLHNIQGVINNGHPYRLP